MVSRAVFYFRVDEKYFLFLRFSFQIDKHTDSDYHDKVCFIIISPETRKHMQTTNMISGGITKSLLLFALPMMAGNLLQQLYNIADTLIVGQFLGADALAAVGSSYTLMTFLTSILLGLCMGSGVVFSLCYGEGDHRRLRQSAFLSFGFIAAITLALFVLSLCGTAVIIRLMQVPDEVVQPMHSYLWVIFWGIPAVFLYNYFAALLRAVGNSVVPLVFLAVSSVLNIGLDLVFVLIFHWGVAGAAAATILSQYLSGVGILLYTLLRFPKLRPKRQEMKWNRAVFRELASFSLLTCVQQSIMNFGILMVQGLVNSFGTNTMAAFAAAVKIDSFAYMPVQDFGNAFSTFAAQNYGAKQFERLNKGIRSAVAAAFCFCVVISLLVCLFAQPLMQIFVPASETEIISIGMNYLWIEGSCYFGIGLLFLLYGIYRAVKLPAMSVVLTVISLGTRVLLAYTLSAFPAIGTTGIWVSVPIGWALADLTGIFYWMRNRRRIFSRYTPDHSDNKAKMSTES